MFHLKFEGKKDPCCSCADGRPDKCAAMLTLHFFFKLQPSTAPTIDASTNGTVGSGWSHDGVAAERGK